MATTGALSQAEVLVVEPPHIHPGHSEARTIGV